MIILRDVSKIRENAELQASNKMLQDFNSAVNHELITPLKCLHDLSQTLEQQVEKKESLRSVKLLQNTIYLLLNQVKSNLDRSMLNANQLSTNFERHYLNGIITHTVDLLNF